MKGNMYVCERSGKHSRRRVKRTAGTDNKEHLFQDTAPRTLLPAVKSGNLVFYVRTVKTCTLGRPEVVSGRPCHLAPAGWQKGYRISHTGCM